MLILEVKKIEIFISAPSAPQFPLVKLSCCHKAEVILMATRKLDKLFLKRCLETDLCIENIHTYFLFFYSTTIDNCIYQITQTHRHMPINSPMEEVMHAYWSLV
jgi:hypothetical protein